jgi:transposase
MYKSIREMVRLVLTSKFSDAAISSSSGFAINTVRRYRKILSRLKHYDWAVLEAMSEEALDNLLNPAKSRPRKAFLEPDWEAIEKALGRKGVTRLLLHQEYMSALPPPGMAMLSEREFCRRLERRRAKLGVTMRQVHKGGEKLFIDYSGQTISYSGEDGKPIRCQLFVSALGASGLIYAEATHTQKLPDWTMSHVRAFEFYGGVPKILVPDCLKSGVTVWRVEGPIINRTYAEVASHYGAVVVPARPRRPQDKGKVENAVKLAQRWIIAVLRDRIILSLADLNAEIRKLLDILNDRPFRRRRDVSRRRLFESIDRPVLQNLPLEPYEYATWKRVKVPRDYHILFDQRHYSAPSTLVGQWVDVRASATAIKIYYQHREVATHTRKYHDFADTTLSIHRPLHHQVVSDDDHCAIKTWGQKLGPATSEVIERFLSNHINPMVCNSQLRGLRALEQKFEPERIEKACERGLLINSFSVRSLRSALQTKMENAPVKGVSEPAPTPIAHSNIRGPLAYGRA